MKKDDGMRPFSLATMLVALLFSLGLQAQSGRVVIMGEMVYDTANPVVRLEEMKGKPVIVSETKMLPEGKFLMELSIPEPGIYRISKSDKDFVMLILQPGDSVSVRTNEASLNSGLNLKGNFDTQLLHLTGYHVGRYEQVLDSLQKVFQALNQSKAPEQDIRAVQDDYLRIRDVMYKYITDGIQGNPYSLSWLFFIEKLDMEQQFPWYARLADSLMLRYPSNTYVKSLHDKVEVERKLAVGSPAPELKGPDPDGNVLALSQYRGKVVLIDFWAAWCGPCRRENPNLVKLYEKYRGKGFEIFAVSLDRTRESWINAIQADGLTWPQISDLKYWQSELAREYKVSSIPHTVLVDRDGNILARKLRGAALEKKLEELLGKVE